MSDNTEPWAVGDWFILDSCEEGERLWTGELNVRRQVVEVVTDGSLFYGLPDDEHRRPWLRAELDGILFLTASWVARRVA